MKNHKAGLLAITLLSTSALAAEEGVTFSHKNWELSCDNTLTCRAAGYDKNDESAGSVLLTREGGPGTPVAGQVVVSETTSESGEKVTQLTLWINGKSAGALKQIDLDYWRLSPEQTATLIAQVKGSGKVEIKGGPAPFILSGDGARAVLLKMDDVQGRLDTPGALVKRGQRAESQVPAAIPAPLIQAVKPVAAQTRPLTDAEFTALNPRLAAAEVDGVNCYDIEPSEGESARQAADFTLTPLDKDHSLIAGQCWEAPYNAGTGYWVIDSALKGEPVLITESGTSYEEGVIASEMKGRGMGDCLSYEWWVWDGKTFQKSSVVATGSCRFVRLGGTWELPTWVTKVIAGGK